ncbi:hypothetical protein BJ878DRAFT_478140 [Calycina marina]|uniref:Uncharacterized protein n=1 Tax=Calycina marina TaxID=1763456 RepID=A0A9P7Z822_9HELO|nr:hypothetical protein BJ878DRAFT_478140 [Calycina marina]
MVPKKDTTEKSYIARSSSTTGASNTLATTTAARSGGARKSHSYPTFAASSRQSSFSTKGERLRPILTINKAEEDEKEWPAAKAVKKPAKAKPAIYKKAREKTSQKNGSLEPKRHPTDNIPAKNGWSVLAILARSQSRYRGTDPEKKTTSSTGQTSSIQELDSNIDASNGRLDGATRSATVSSENMRRRSRIGVLILSLMIEMRERAGVMFLVMIEGKKDPLWRTEAETYRMLAKMKETDPNERGLNAFWGEEKAWEEGQQW